MNIVATIHFVAPSGAVMNFQAPEALTPLEFQQLIEYKGGTPCWASYTAYGVDSDGDPCDHHLRDKTSYDLAVWLVGIPEDDADRY